MIRRFPSLKRVKDQNDNLRTLGGFNDDPLNLKHITISKFLMTDGHQVTQLVRDYF